ncbi:MAG: hypothetical protein AAF587_15250 [Bacteroidota bacterium]
MHNSLEHLTHTIDSQLDWGDRSNWTNRDFQELSELIFTNTKKQLSVTTLKRLWGRAKLSSQPSVSTLDILSEFAGYDSWRVFTKTDQQPKEVKSPPSEAVHLVQSPWLRWSLLGIGLISIFWVSQLQLVDVPYELTEAERETIQFEFEKVTSGYPNTVIFRYDLGDVPFDTLEIQQSWDRSHRIPLNKSKGLVTATYYESGYFTTKLVRNEQIIKTKDLYIPTKGWQGIIGGNVPDLMYVQEDQLRIDEAVYAGEKTLEEMNKHPFAILLLSHLSPNPHIDSRDAVVEAEFRLSTPTQNSKCQSAWMTIIGSKEVYRFQFSIPGCVGDLNFFLNMERISGKHNDLSAFGLDLKEWTQVKVVSKDSTVHTYINGESVFERRLHSDIGQIGGVQFGFEGLGEIRSLVLRDQEEEDRLIGQ